MEYRDLPHRLAAVRERIAAACHRSGRDPAGVTVIAVTKTHPPSAVHAAVAAGIVDIGENRVQELDEKVSAAGRSVARWHLIGHLQRNKARRAIELADLIHSLDSLRLAEKVSEEAVRAGRTVPVLVQVNVSGEETKGGFEGSGAVEGIGRVAELPGLEIRGLMTMAPFTDDTAVVRSVFRRTGALLDEVRRQYPTLPAMHLSMGMSGDFEIAVEEGSTMVRLGTILLGERET